ncbi:hypothetical protein NXY26_12000 [Parabacteroides distasonis]|nr:hypothetical protein NXY26_12000 [Parabacteroides distasonis]
MENSNVFESIKYSYKIAELDEKANSCSEENPIGEFSVKIEFHNINKSILDIGITSFVSPLHLACHNDPINKPLFEFKAKYYGSPDKPGGLSIQLCKSEKKEFYIRYSS